MNNKGVGRSWVEKDMGKKETNTLCGHRCEDWIREYSELAFDLTPYLNSKGVSLFEKAETILKESVEKGCCEVSMECRFDLYSKWAYFLDDASQYCEAVKKFELANKYLSKKSTILSGFYIRWWTCLSLIGRYYDGKKDSYVNGTIEKLLENQLIKQKNEEGYKDEKYVGRNSFYENLYPTEHKPESLCELHVCSAHLKWLVDSNDFETAKVFLDDLILFDLDSPTNLYFELNIMKFGLYDKSIKYLSENKKHKLLDGVLDDQLSFIENFSKQSQMKFFEGWYLYAKYANGKEQGQSRNDLESQSIECFKSSLDLEFDKTNDPLQKESQSIVEKLYLFDRVDKYFLQNVQSQSISLRDPRKFNDPFESGKGAPWENVMSNLRVKSFSSTSQSKDGRLNNLMWSHYADSHQGICLEFNYSEVKPDNVQGHTQLFEVEYNSSLMVNGVKSIFAKKGRQWEHENEFRLVHYNPDSEMEEFHALTYQQIGLELQSVCFGLEMPKEIKDLLYNTFNDLAKEGRKPKFFEMKRVSPLSRELVRRVYKAPNVPNPSIESTVLVR